MKEYTLRTTEEGPCQYCGYMLYATDKVIVDSISFTSEMYCSKACADQQHAAWKEADRRERTRQSNHNLATWERPHQPKPQRGQDSRYMPEPSDADPGL